MHPRQTGKSPKGTTWSAGIDSSQRVHMPLSKPSLGGHGHHNPNVQGFELAKAIVDRDGGFVYDDRGMSTHKYLACSADRLTATVTATAADQLCLRLAFDRDPAPARRTIRHQKGLYKPDLEVGDAGLEPATSSL
jgi:hypothetical protein